MKRPAARLIHEATNVTYWAKLPGWDAGDDVGFGFRCLQALPFSLHGALKQVFFKSDGLIAVSAESVVVANGSDKIDKFMFRYPGKMPLETFRNKVEHEVGIVTHCLAGIALATEVSIKPARVFRWPSEIPAVTQTQTRLDLDMHRALDLPAVAQESPSRLRDRTAKDLALILKGADELINRYGYYPDLSHHSGNLQRSVLDGSVTLIDVMPFYADGSRLIGDSPPEEVIPHIQDNIISYRDFVGQYGR